MMVFDDSGGGAAAAAAATDDNLCFEDFTSKYRHTLPSPKLTFRT